MILPVPISSPSRHQGPDLRVVVVGSAGSGPARLLVAGLVRAVRHAGHQLTEMPLHDLVRSAQAAAENDILILLEGGSTTLPAQLATTRLLRGPTIVLLDAGSSTDGSVHLHSLDMRLRRHLFSTVDIVLSGTAEGADRARLLGAAETVVIPLPSGVAIDGDALTPGWARYVATLETIATRRAARSSNVDVARRAAAQSIGGRVAAARRALRSRSRDLLATQPGTLRLGFRDLPEWVQPTDILRAHSEAVEVRTLARRLGLPFTTRKVAAWAALGALSAVLRVRDGNRRSSVIVDAAGPSSVFTRWASAIGYAPVALDPALLDPASADVLIRLHPNGCTSADIDDTLSQASRLLRRSGLLCVTVPIGGPDVPAALLPADLRAVIARADALGLVLVGDLDRDLAGVLTSIHSRVETDRAAPGRAQALVRLTFRRAS